MLDLFHEIAWKMTNRYLWTERWERGRRYLRANWPLVLIPVTSYSALALCIRFFLAGADVSSIRLASQLMATSMAAFFGLTLLMLRSVNDTALREVSRLRDLYSKYRQLLPDFRELRLKRYRSITSGQRDFLKKQASPMTAYTHRDVYLAMCALERFQQDEGLVPLPWKNLYMMLAHLGYSQDEIASMFAIATKCRSEPAIFFKTLEAAEQATTSPVDLRPPRDELMLLREEWGKDQISSSLRSLERGEKATGTLFWVTAALTALILVATSILILGLPDLASDLSIARWVVVGIASIWIANIACILAYIKQFI